jgi:hypothetical protein
MRTLLRALAAIAALALPATAAPVCPAGRSPVVILGTFHMANPGQDAVNTVVDMSTERRQREILALVERLARWRPTRIAIEAARVGSPWPERYAAWAAGTYAMGMNEIEQVGFRLAKQTGATLAPVDYPMWMNGLTPAERQPPPRPPRPAPPAPAPDDPVSREVRAEVAREEEHLARSTVSEHLAYLNTPARTALRHRWDVISNLEPGDGVAIYENTDLATNWYKRNLRIVTNLIAATTATDRVLLIIGVGHARILRDLLTEHPRFCVVDVAEVLR